MNRQLFPRAAWTDDCQGKKNYDGPLLRIDTRYWPGPGGGGSTVVVNEPGRRPEIYTQPYGPQPSAHASILLMLGAGCDEEYLVWREQEFTALTEAEVKAQVERWVKEQFDDVIRLLGGAAAFKADS